MKRLIALAALLVAASACTTTDNTNTGAGNANANATANANAAAATPTPAVVSQADIEAKERQTWDAMKAKNWDAFAGMLTDEFVYVTDGGVLDKTQTTDGAKKYDLTDYTFSDIKFLKVDADLAVITYTSVEKSTTDGKPNSDKPVRNTTAWINRGGKWMVAYHQDTDVMQPAAGQPTPGASPASSPAASASASPASSPSASPSAPATATDAEKQVWDAFKRKDWDAFSNVMASEFLEVEPEAVYDKSGSVEGVKRANFAHATLGDFKEVKFDADATLVTYTVKSPDKGWPPAGMRHSSIWVNRGGQWKAYFHQGTFISKPRKM
jgi:predicted small secreted protein